MLLAVFAAPIGFEQTVKIDGRALIDKTCVARRRGNVVVLKNSNIQVLKARAADFRKVAAEATIPVARKLANRMAAEVEQLATEARQSRSAERKGVATS